MNPSDVWVPLDKLNPWPGFLAFMEQDEEFFAGRELESDELFRLVQRERLAVLFGRNGLGKTSLLHAGLFPRLRKAHFLPVYLRVDYSDDAPPPVAQVRAALEKAAADANVDAPRVPEGITLWEYFHLQDSGFWDAGNELVTPVLILDQFEEIFQTGARDAASNTRARAFLQELADLVEGRPSEELKRQLDSSAVEAGRYTFSEHHYKVVISLREDYLADLESARWRMPSVMTNRFRLLPMDGRSARAVAFRPPVVVDETTAEMIVRAVGRRAPLIHMAGGGDEKLEELEVDPLLLSVFCRELNEKRKSRGVPTIGVDLLRANANSILHEHYQRQMVGMPPSVRRFVEWSLVLPGGLRDSVAWKSAEEELGQDAYLLNALVRRRLLTKDARNQVDRVELSHDRLALVIFAARPQHSSRLRAWGHVSRWRTTAAAALVVLAVAAAMEYRARKDGESLRRELSKWREQSEHARANERNAANDRYTAEEKYRVAVREQREAEAAAEKARVAAAEIADGFEVLRKACEPKQQCEAALMKWQRGKNKSNEQPSLDSSNVKPARHTAPVALPGAR